MRIAILGNPEGWYPRDLERAALNRHHEVLLLPFERLVAEVTHQGTRVTSGGQLLSEFDAVIVRTMPPGSLEQVVFRMDSLARLEASGRVVLNPTRSIECAVDKFLATARLQAAGLPVPDTIVCESSEEALIAFEKLGGDVVVKPIFGAEGRGILRVSDPDLALRVFRTLERIQSILYLQKFIDHPGFDVRVLVLDGKAIGAMRRHNPDDFRTNVSRDAVPAPHQLTPIEEEWAIRATESVGARLAGIDILYSRSGQGYVIEVNGVPGWRGLQRVTGADYASLIIESLER